MAHEIAHRSGRKTIAANHVLEAIENLEFPSEMFLDEMEAHLEGEFPRRVGF